MLATAIISIARIIFLVSTKRIKLQYSINNHLSVIVPKVNMLITEGQSSLYL